MSDIEAQVENFRRSAAMAPLGAAAAHELLALAIALCDERRQMRRVLDDIPADFGRVREALNQLARTLH